MSRPASALANTDDRYGDEDDTPVISAVIGGVPKLMIDDAFTSGDNDNDADTELGGSTFDLASVVRSSRHEEAQFEHAGDLHNSADSVHPTSLESSADTSASIPAISIRNGRVLPPPLRIVTPNLASSTLPELDDSASGSRYINSRDQFEDISLSPPTSPRNVATTSLSRDHVPVPVTPHALASPSSSTAPSLNPSTKSLSSADPRIIRSMSPRPHYLSPSSTVPVPQSVDPVPRRPPTPSIVEHGPTSPTTNSRPSSYSSSGPPSPSTARQSSKHIRSAASSSSSALEKVLSKTRPAHLPPKPRAEDLKHQRDWDEMMRRSRQADEARLEQQRLRAREREMAIGEKMAIWEREIVPDWRKVLRPGNERLRRLWWDGIPGNLRGRLWAAAIGNGLALSKETYKTCSARAQRALSAGTFPTDILAEIENDVQNTLPNLHIFNAEYGPMHQDLKDLLCAWVVSRSDEGLGYVRGASNVAAMFILNMPVDQAFLAMRNLLERHCLRSFYGGEGSDDDLEAYYRIFDTLLADGMPKVYFNFKQHQISPSTYLPDWVAPLFLNHLPFELTARLWDVIILEGDSFLFRVAIGVLGILESRLFFPERKELMEVLRGENKAALDVARRTGVIVDLSARYEQYGMSEQALWDRIYEMDEWWRESTWARLITRELPDL